MIHINGKFYSTCLEQNRFFFQKISLRMAHFNTITPNKSMKETLELNAKATDTVSTASVHLATVLGPLVPHLDLAGPVAGGCGCREDGMLGDAQAGLGVRAEVVQRPSGLVIVEVGRAGGASRGQDASVRRELAAHGVSLHLWRRLRL